MSIRKLDTPDDVPEIWQVDSDMYGNSRYVVHYSAIPYVEYTGNSIIDFRNHQSAEIENAREALGGKRYRAKWYGGGIVFQAYAGDPIGHVRAAILGKNQAEYYAEIHG